MMMTGLKRQPMTKHWRDAGFTHTIVAHITTGRHVLVDAVKREVPDCNMRLSRAGTNQSRCKPRREFTEILHFGFDISTDKRFSIRDKYFIAIYERRVDGD